MLPIQPLSQKSVSLNSHLVHILKSFYIYWFSTTETKVSFDSEAILLVVIRMANAGQNETVRKGLWRNHDLSVLKST